MEVSENVRYILILSRSVAHILKNRISTTGSSEYRLNAKVVTYQTYNNALEQQNILVKAKNFLVFQVREI